MSGEQSAPAARVYGRGRHLQHRLMPMPQRIWGAEVAPAQEVTEAVAEAKQQPLAMECQGSEQFEDQEILDLHPSAVDMKGIGMEASVCDASTSTVELPEAPAPAPATGSLTKPPSSRFRRRGMLFGGLEDVPLDPELDPPGRHCYICWQFGHNRKECKLSTDDPYCYNCGRYGERMQTCPRCSKAYERWVQETADKKKARENVEAENRSAKKVQEKMNEPSSETPTSSARSRSDVASLGSETRQYTSEELRQDVYKQLEVLASMPPALQEYFAAQLKQKEERQNDE